jgi:hypothetical protein
VQDDEHLSPPLIRWSVQEIRRIAVRLARRRIRPATSSLGHFGYGPIKPQLEKRIRSEECNCNARLRSYYGSQKVTVAAMQMAEKKVWAQRT